MKTKIFDVLLAMLFLAITGCDKNNNVNEEPTSSSTIKCTPSVIEDDGSGDTYSVTIYSSHAWTATSNKSWVTCSPTSGQGDAFVSVEVKNGPTDSAKVMFTNGENAAILTIRRVVVNAGKENGHDRVDLGLSVYWGTMNVGAFSETEDGTFYAWGETTPRPDNYTLSQYKFYDSSSNKYTKYVQSSSYGTPDYKDVLDLNDDVANIKWGGRWRIPTKEEYNELAKNCTFSKELNGYRVTGPNGNSIFMPWAQYKYGGLMTYFQNTCGYWSAYGYDRDAYFFTLEIKPTNVFPTNRVAGMLIRPVCDK